MRIIMENKKEQIHSLSDQQLKDVSGGVIEPWSTIHYKCSRCTYSDWSDRRMNTCPLCHAELIELETAYDEPSLE